MVEVVLAASRSVPCIEIEIAVPVDYCLDDKIADRHGEARIVDRRARAEGRPLEEPGLAPAPSNGAAEGAKGIV